MSPVHTAHSFVRKSEGFGDHEHRHDRHQHELRSSKQDHTPIVKCRRTLEGQVPLCQRGGQGLGALGPPGCEIAGNEKPRSQEKHQ